MLLLRYILRQATAIVRKLRRTKILLRYILRQVMAIERMLRRTKNCFPIAIWTTKTDRLPKAGYPKKIIVLLLCRGQWWVIIATHDVGVLGDGALNIVEDDGVEVEALAEEYANGDG